MMKDSYDKEFDLGVRSLLENATEEVPSGVWEAVSGRVARRRRAATWRRWSVAGLSAAAAAALVLGLSGVFSRPRPADDGIVVAQNAATESVQDSAAPSDAGIQAQEEALSVSDALSGLTASAQGVRYATTKRQNHSNPANYATTKKTSVPDAAASFSDAAPAAGTVSVNPADASAENGGASVQDATKPASAPTADKRKTSFDDPFARMAYEDARRKDMHRLSFDIKGLVGTNDNTSAGEAKGSVIMAASGKTTGTVIGDAVVENSESLYNVPVSFGVSARYRFSDKWSLGAGLTYSALSRSFDGSFYKGGVVVNGSNKEPIYHTVRYIGVPVNVYYNLMSNKFVDMYAFAGGSLEKGISQSYRYFNGSSYDVWKSGVEGLQFSADLGMGVQFNVTDHVGFYVDPSARYYFGANQPKSLRTVQPFMFSLELGLRFNF